MKKIYKRALVGAAMCGLTTIAALIPLNAFSSRAAEGLVTWQDAGKKGEQRGVKINVQLDEDEIFDESATFQLALLLDPGPEGEIEECDFTFKRNIKRSSSEDIVIQEKHYDEDSHELLLVIAGRRDKDGKGGVLNKEQALELGTLYVVSKQDVTVSLIEEKCLAVDESGIQQNFSQLGNQENTSYVLKAEEDIEESEPPVVTPPSEEEPPVVTPPSEEDNENDGNGSRGGGGSGGPTGPTATPGPGNPVETKGSWEKTETGAWRFKKENAVYAQNEWLLNGGLWYRIGEDGLLVTGWFQFEGKWYYLRPSGEMAIGWQKDQDWWYHLGVAGAMDIGWIQIDGKWYLLNEIMPVPQKRMDPATGQMIESTEGQMPYGALYVNTTTPDGYVVDESGRMVP
ncbi:MAG: N-acetylmuramoyl-L-alanine amidase family protein [Lachnospiraceae bacterium]|jgi:glucan-binding YG repeat protein|nr:N-acetylmuramoyl-L-alanine amidase family protein [Lachnospiraceae bacterium]